MCFDCCALALSSGGVCYVTLREERLRRTKAAGETGADLQVPPPWEARVLLAARVRYPNTH